LITNELGLFLISKLNRNTALFLPYQGSYSGKGRPCKYGKKLNYQNLPKKYLVDHYWEGDIEHSIYQIKGCWTKRMPTQINVVILISYNPQTEKSTRVLFFSTDLNLDAHKLLKYYSLRFQIEFNFRDAKQYFGLADFKNTRKQQVDNAIGVAFFMDNLSLILCQEAQEIWQEETVSVQDLKAWFRAEKYLFEILNTLEIAPETILIQHKLDHLGTIGAINRTKKHPVVV